MNLYARILLRVLAPIIDELDARMKREVEAQLARQSDETVHEAIAEVSRGSRTGALA